MPENRMPKAELGSTGVVLPRFGMGGECVYKHGAEDEAERVFLSCMRAGIKYLDTAHDYENSQERIGRLLGAHRPTGIFIATKSTERDGEKFLRQLEVNSEKLGRRPDIMHVHAIGEGEDKEVLRRGGPLAAAVKAKERGLCRFVGITAHDDPRTMERIVRGSEGVDVAMVAISAGDTRFLKSFVPLCKERGIGVVAMKVMGRAQLVRPDGPGVRTAAQAMAFALSTPADIAIVGFSFPEEVEELAGGLLTHPQMGPEEMKLLVEGTSAYADEVQFYKGPDPDWEGAVKMRKSLDEFKGCSRSSRGISE